MDEAAGERALSVAANGGGGAPAATTINVVVAILVAGTTGFLGGKLDVVVRRFVDAWIAFRDCSCCSPSCLSWAGGCCR